MKQIDLREEFEKQFKYSGYKLGRAGALITTLLALVKVYEYQKKLIKKGKSK